MLISDGSNRSEVHELTDKIDSPEREPGRNHPLPTNLKVVEEVVGVSVSNNVSEVCPGNIDPREDGETSKMRTDGLGIVSTNKLVLGQHMPPEFEYC